MLAMEKNKAFNPIEISLLGSSRIVLHPQLVAYLIKEFRGLCHDVFI